MVGAHTHTHPHTRAHTPTLCRLIGMKDNVAQLNKHYGFCVHKTTFEEEDEHCQCVSNLLTGICLNINIIIIIIINNI